jgi:hypothetical protein
MNKFNSRNLTKEEIKKIEDLTIKMIEEQWKKMSPTMALYQMCILICGLLSSVATFLVVGDLYKSILSVIFVLMLTFASMVVYGFSILNNIIKECTSIALQEIVGTNIVQKK